MKYCKIRYMLLFITLKINNDSTISNYGYQLLDGSNTTISAVRGANSLPTLLYLSALNKLGMNNIILFSKSGFVRTLIQERNNDISGTTIDSIRLGGWSWNNTVNNIASLVITSDQVNGLAIGTIIELWALRKKI